jgi:hypothetical protein
MRTWPKLMGSLAALTIGLIACFAPSDQDVVDTAASRLPFETPMFAALAVPELLLAELSDLLGQEALSPESWVEAGLDLTQPLTLARWPGEPSFWVISCAVANDALAEDGLNELLDTLTVAHRVVLEPGRVHALVALTRPDPELWRTAARALEKPEGGRRLVHAPGLERLGNDDLMVHLRAEDTATLLELPAWAAWLAQAVDTCTLRASERQGDWRGALRCLTGQPGPLHEVLRASNGALSAPGEDIEAGLQLGFSPEHLAEVWATLADEDPDADAAHTQWLDVAERSGVSPSSLWAEALTGELTVSVSRWPVGHRRMGLMATLGVDDEATVGRVLAAVLATLDEQPGVRLERERTRGIEGWRVEWLRHRGQDVSWAQAEGQLWVAYGSADLEDALAEVEEPQWQAGDGPGSAWLDLGQVSGLESVLGEMTFELIVDEEALGLSWQLARPGSVATQQTLAGLLGWGKEHVCARRRARLLTQLTAVCDALDIHAIDHGLAQTLSELEGAVDTLDPWGRELDYARPATRRPHHRYDLCSRGPDGVAETSDDVCYD